MHIRYTVLFTKIFRSCFILNTGFSSLLSAAVFNKIMTIRMRIDEI
jgi:hypothetical protein